MLIDNPWILLGTVTLGVCGATFWGWLVARSLKNHGFPYFQLKMALTGAVIAASVPIALLVNGLLAKYAGAEIAETAIGPTTTGEVFGICAAFGLFALALPHPENILLASKMSFTRRVLRRYAPN